MAALHKLLLRVASQELSRRREQLGSICGPEIEDLAHRAAGDALVNVLADVDEFHGRSRFTTWACKLVVFEVSGVVARHASRQQPPGPQNLSLDRLTDSLAPRPDDRVDRREQLEALSAAIDELPDRQREAFVAIELDDVRIDVLALRLRTSRGAVHQDLLDAKRSLRARMAAAGHPVAEQQDAA